MIFLLPTFACALSSANIPLDSQIYDYLGKLSGAGLISHDFVGIRPLAKSEVARLVHEAEAAQKLMSGDAVLAEQMIERIKVLIPREYALYRKEETTPLFDLLPFDRGQLRYVYLDGVPRSYERPVHDPGNDGVFGIGSGLRPANPYPSPAMQHGTEGTPLFPNNEGIVYGAGSNFEFRFSTEAYASRYGTMLVEPLLSYAGHGENAALRLNKVYGKIGSGALELEVGRDTNWLGIGYRGNITLTDNARSMDMVKLSSPEPFTLWKLGQMKYALIASRLDKTNTGGIIRQPYFYALKLSLKPTDNLEVGFNLGRQVGGPGVKNGVGDSIRGLIGGTNADNSNGLAGFDARYRIPFLRNTEIYGEFSGEDTAGFWPIVESYVAGFYIPNLTTDGRNDLRFEYFQGNQILYTNGTFPEGYLYKGMPIGHSQGGAVQDFFARYTHWFSARNNLALEYSYSLRGNVGAVKVDNTGLFDANGTMQAVERKNSARVQWHLPLHGDFAVVFLCGYEHIINMNLVPGVVQNNKLFAVDLNYRY